MGPKYRIIFHIKLILLGLSLDRTALAMQKVLDTEWWSQPTFASFLQECELDFQAVSGTGTVIRGKCAPDFALFLPRTLQSYSLGLKHLCKELQKNLSVRRVGNSVYLATFATYIEAVSQQQIPWDVIAELVNAARPATWEEKHVDASLLRKSFRNFTRRNGQLYRQIRADIAEYLATCAKLPPKERPTLTRWTLDRLTVGKQPS